MQRVTDWAESVQLPLPKAGRLPPLAGGGRAGLGRSFRTEGWQSLARYLTLWL